jgi:flavin reductase (DIM6/NTAB) family NADH-FMN oxidoreductase RutF
MDLNLAELTPADKQYFLQHIIAPRPICLASTIDTSGAVNLSPFSFFNIFSANPPIVIFSPARRVRDNTIKHTLENVTQVPEVVINIVDYNMVHQTSLASSEYTKGIDEFVKGGFTKERSVLVKPPMVKESKAKLECKVIEIKSLGEEGGAGQLVICEVLMLHLDDCLLDEKRKIDQTKLNLVARLGGDWYCKVTKENLFTVPKPTLKPGIGIDQLPAHIRNSVILSGNHLGQLANVEVVPKVNTYVQMVAMGFSDLHAGIQSNSGNIFLHHAAKNLIDQGRIDWAWQVLLLEEVKSSFLGLEG